MTVEVFDAYLLVPSTLHDAGDSHGSLRSLLLICIFKAALACLASMQMTGNPSLFSSVQSQVAVAPVSSPTRATCGACDLMNAAITFGSEGTTRAAMEYCVGLDVSLKLTAICIIDQTGKIDDG